MKIVLNAASAKMGGAVTYLTNVLRCLPGPESGMEFTVYLLPETAAKVHDVAPNVHLVLTRIGNASMLKRLWWEQVTLRRALKKMRADALYSTSNFAMFRCPVRQLLLVRNTLYFSGVYRRMFLPKHPLRYRIDFELRRWLIVWSAKSADVVMTPTRAMLDELREYVRLDDRKTLVNHYGVSFSDLSAEKEEGLRVLNCPRTGTTKLLFVSTYCEHKNLGTLLKALPILNQKSGRKFFLKTTADPGWEVANWTTTRASDMALTQRPDVAPWLQIVGLQTRAQIAHLYADTDIFVFPSLTESFGFPMAEAMAFGVPIVAADTAVNREICGDAAVYFSPLDPQDLAETAIKLAGDQSRRMAMSMKGRAQARRRFGWTRHSRLLIDKLRTAPTADSLPALAGRTKREWARPS